MKKILLQLSLLLLTGNVFGQNRIPNGDFEEGPNQSSEGWGILVAGPDSWVAVNGTTPDRLYMGDPIIGRDNQPSFSGNAYIELYGKDTAQSLEAEIAKVILKSPLISGNKYKLRFHLDIDDNFYNAMAGIAFRFSGGDSIASTLQGNTGKWEPHSLTFTADFNSSEMEIICIGGPSLVKLDSISLEPDSTVKIEEYTKLSITDIYPYPNPFSNYLIIPISKSKLNSSEVNSIILTDMKGKYFYPKTDFLFDKIIIHRGEIPCGNYTLSVKEKNKEFKCKISIF